VSPNLCGHRSCADIDGTRERRESMRISTKMFLVHQDWDDTIQLPYHIAFVAFEILEDFVCEDI
jgi:hypothetical protein